MDAALLRNLFEYEPTSGQLIHRQHERLKNRQWLVGKPAGWVNKRGYVDVRVYNKTLAAHRIIFFIVQGDCPAMVDHIDGNPANNSWANLRPATNSQNQANQLLRKNGTQTGIKGVSFWKPTKKYHARIRVNGVSKFLGSFTTIDAAAAAYAEASKNYFGEYGRAA